VVYNNQIYEKYWLFEDLKMKHFEN